MAVTTAGSMAADQSRFIEGGRKVKKRKKPVDGMAKARRGAGGKGLGMGLKMEGDTTLGAKGTKSRRPTATMDSTAKSKSKAPGATAGGKAGYRKRMDAAEL